MKFVFTFTKPEDGEKVEFEGGRTSLWEAQEASEKWPERSTNNSRLDFAWGYFAAKRAEKLKELGIDGMELDEAIDSLADNYDMAIRDNKAPLADGEPA